MELHSGNTENKDIKVPKEFKQKLEKMFLHRKKMLLEFSAIENKLDYEEVKKVEFEKVKRRKKTTAYRDYIIKPIPQKERMKDLETIRCGLNTPLENLIQKYKINKGDSVKCIIEGKKYTGIIARISCKSITIHCKDKKKIKLEWKVIESQNIKIIKSYG